VINGSCGDRTAGESDIRRRTVEMLTDETLRGSWEEGKKAGRTCWKGNEKSNADRAILNFLSKRINLEPQPNA
jgi:hypothetical protein